ncbi:CLUMA_CG015859, isoform A [Clunio marinus]|uniref:CLUMA_CG015859, isoform A n=1 Tax=Clunio marinus TaxID=568069 RepID=A0A1J1IRI6_9DIPT|nr:CLUMA_CG015859, isoform A [Clunio marinus]
MNISSLNHLLLQFALLLLLLNNYETVAYHDDMHNVAKRLDVDICTERFDIHSSTIIRTEESKLMGAKFLNDEDVATADTCLKMCCETSECDVFIYEEKSTGTCFLFHCGMPDNFRCKFTSHSNYTSGILTVPRREFDAPTNPPLLAALKPKLSQNELELVNLKRPSNAYHLSPDLIPQTTSTIMPNGVRLVDVTSTSSTSTTKSSCGRFQFQCQTSRECIAIYNVCDQIAQCDDGSDEGPECPTTNSAAKTLPNVVESQPRLDNQVNRNRVVMPVNINDNFNQMPRPMLHNREDPLSAPKYPQSHVTQYTDTDTDSRIFNHKNGLLSGNFPQQFPTKLQHDPFMMPQQPDPQMIEDPMYREQPQMTRNDWPQIMPQQSQIPQVKQNPVWPDKLVKETPVVIDKTRKKVTNKDDAEYSEEYSETDESQSEYESATTTEAPKKKSRKHKKVKGQKDKQKNHEKPLHDQLKQLKNSKNVEAQFITEHSGHVEKPTGAVLSLTLGCLVLAALSVLIGCRLRRVNVRRRRGKSVEADYLVNGLYL